MSNILRGVGAGSQTYVVSGTADRVAVFNSNGEISASTTTSDQLSYLAQTQTLTEVTLLDAQASALNLITYQATDFPFSIIEYSIERGSDREFGVLRVVANSSVVNFSQEQVSVPTVGAVGVTISALINSGEVRIQYTTTSTGNDAKCNFIVRRWDEVV